MFRRILLAALLTGSMALSGVASCEGFFGPEEFRLRPGSHILCEQNSDCPGGEVCIKQGTGSHICVQES